jgi:intergrase/recombinase
LKERYPEGIPLSEIPKLSERKWSRYLIRKVAQYLWGVGKIELEDKSRIEFLARSRKKLEAPRAPEVSIEDFRTSLARIKDWRYRLVYLIMYYSGARIEEAVKLVKASKELKEVSHEESVRYRGYVNLGRAVRVALHFNRGRKRFILYVASRYLAAMRL